MKILSAQQIREADIFTIKEQNIHSHELMERAAKVFSNWYLDKLNIFNKIHIVCGTGNNGGDGLCIARHLSLKGNNIHVFIIGDANNASADFQLNYDRLKKVNSNIRFSDANNLSNISACDCIIDALFGTGLNRPPDEFATKVIETINSSSAYIISVDVPSGLFADIPTLTECVKADVTFSFELPKLCFFFPENKKFIGEWIVKKIGLSENYLNQIKTSYNFLTELKVKEILQPRDIFSHKGSYGHALIVAGKPGMTGAAELCGYACLKAGAGLVTVSTGETTSEHAELMTMKRNEINEEILHNKFNALAIGPGFGNAEDEVQLLKLILHSFTKPVVIDADALNIISEHKELLDLIPENSILTPHPKEFERLFGTHETWMDLINLILEKSNQYKVFIIYKRAFSIIASPDGSIFFNSTGNSGMSTAGSGDVLTGILAAMLAQKYSPENAALLGTYLHGLSADFAMKIFDGQNIVAGNIIEYIQKAYREVKEEVL